MVRFVTLHVSCLPCFVFLMYITALPGCSSDYGPNPGTVPNVSSEDAFQNSKAHTTLANSSHAEVNQINPLTHLANSSHAEVNQINPLTQNKDRNAAIAMLALGANLVIIDPSGKEVNVANVKELPDGDFELYVVAGPAKAVRESDLAPLAGLTRLTILNLSGCPVNDASLERLHNLDALTSLSLAGTKISQKGLVVVQRFPKLRFLELNNSHIGDSDLAVLANHPSLLDLHVNISSVTDMAVPHLLRIPKLITISLIDTKLTDAGLAEFVRL